MNRIFIYIAVVIGLFGIVILVSNNSSSKSKPSQFSVVQQDLASGAVLLDVRTPEEFAAGHIDGATNLDLQVIQTGSRPSVKSGKTVYVYCHSGSRATQAATILTQAGYKVDNLGAMTAVEAMGGKVIQ